MPDMVVDVVPEETIYLITHNGPGAFKLSGFPRCVVVLGNEPHTIQQGENIPRNQPQLEESIKNPQFHRPENEPGIDDRSQREFRAMNDQFLAAKLLQGIQQEELKNGEHSADEHVGIKKEKIGKRPLPHCKGIGVFGSAVVAMVLKVIFFE